MASEDTTNFYQPGSADEAPGPVKGPKAPAGRSAVSWKASEYVEHQRGPVWYLLLLVATAAIAGVVYLTTKDFFATGTIVVLGIIVAAAAGRKPAQMDFELNSTSLRAGQKTYSYHLFKSFSIIREGRLTSLSLTPLKRFQPPVSAYFDPKDEKKIIDAIGEHLPYEERGPSGIDRLSLRLRL